MTSREKRTTTQPGLGQVPGDPRSTAIRERASAAPLAREDARSEPPSSEPPSRAPISGAPPSARQTRAIGSVPAGAAPDEPPSTKPADTKAMAQADRLDVRPPVGRQADRRATTAPDLRRASPGKGRQATLRPIDGRPHDSGRPLAGPSERPRPSRAAGARAASSKPPRRPTNRPPPPASGSTPSRPVRPAKSARVSIREDDLGAAVKSGAAAAGVAGRQVPRIVRTKDEIAEAPIDHRAGFLLAHIDGVTDVQGLVDIAGMPESDVHEILDRLRRLGIVTIR